MEWMVAELSRTGGCHGQSNLPQAAYRTPGDRSVQRFHFRGREGMGSPEGRCRGKRLHSSYAAGVDRRTERGASHLLCDASPVPSRRLRDLDVHRADSEANGCIPHMLQVLTAARNAGLHIFYAMHRRYRPGDYETWTYIAPIQK